MNAIKTENLKYVYGAGTPFEKTAINNMNIEIEKGDFVGLIGHTGSGKSTLISHLNGLLKPTSGKVYINGEDIWADKAVLRSIRFKVGLVFQYPEYQLFESTVYRDISYGPKNMGLDDKEVDRRVREACELVELRSDMLDASPFELSGGQKRRCAIAGVLAMKPEILICDEPSAGLDPHGRDRIFRVIRNYYERTGATVLVVSHSMEDVATFANNVLVLNRGSVYRSGSVDEIFSYAEEIRSIGLGVPQITRVFIKLHEQFPEIPKNIYTLEHAHDVLLPLLRREAKK